jgi:hypothetical protein
MKIKQRIMKESNPPHAVYELIEIRYTERLDENREPIAPTYPEFEVHECGHGLYSTLAKAEQKMRERIEEFWYNPKDVFGFEIRKVYLDLDDYSSTCHIYLPDGSLLDECLASGDQFYKNIGKHNEFFGRPAEKVRFQKGDLAEQRIGDWVGLVIICETPYSPEEASERTQKYLAKHPSSGYHLDNTDDYYFVYDVCEKGKEDCSCELCYAYDDPHPTQLFPVRFPVSDEIKNYLEKRYQKYLTLVDESNKKL